MHLCSDPIATYMTGRNLEEDLQRVRMKRMSAETAMLSVRHRAEDAELFCRRAEFLHRRLPPVQHRLVCTRCDLRCISSINILECFDPGLIENCTDQVIDQSGSKTLNLEYKLALCLVMC